MRFMQLVAGFEMHDPGSIAGHAGFGGTRTVPKKLFARAKLVQIRFRYILAVP